MAKKNKAKKVKKADIADAFQEVKKAGKAFAKALDKHMETMNGFHSGEVKIGNKTLIKKGTDLSQNATFYLYMRFNEELVEADERTMEQKKADSLAATKKYLEDRGAIVLNEPKKDIVETSTNKIAV